MRARTVAAAAAAALALAAAPAGAKGAVLEDPRGDYPVAVGDIVSADFSTTHGGTAKLVVTLSLAAAPSPATPYSYHLRFVAGRCRFQVIYFGHAGDGVLNKSAMGCDDGDRSTPLEEGNARVRGETITWSVPLSREIRPGAVITEISAGTEPGGASTGTQLQAAGDSAATDRTYRIGS